MSTSSDYAASLADADGELIQLSLRGLPVYPSPLSNNGSEPPPEAAFVVAGGPVALLREVLLPPYPLDEAPAQVYAGLEEARRLQSRSAFKPAVGVLTSVIRVWRKKHVWKLLRDDPAMTLQDALEEEVRRSEQRRRRALAKEEQRRKREEDEAEFARRMAEGGGEAGEGDGEEQADAAAAAAPAATGDRSDSDSEIDSDDEHDEHGHHGRGRRKSHGGGGEHSSDKDAQSSADLAAAAAAAAAAEAEEQDDVLEFPEVTPEEELEFLVYFYNALGSVYQSAAAAPSNAASAATRSAAQQRVTSAGGDGSGGVRWGRMKVVPCLADDPAIRHMLRGTKSGAQVGESGARTGGSNATEDESGTSSMFAAASMDEDPSAAAGEEGEDEEADPLAADEEFLATSASDVSNNSSLRALIALWQAKRVHDLYVQMKQADKMKHVAMQRAAEAAARSGNAQGNNNGDDDDASSNAHNNDDGSSVVLGPDGQPVPSSLNAHTTLGQAAFASLNHPNFPLDAMQAESKAMGLFGFPLVGGSGSGSGSGSGGKGGQQQRDQENSLLFWSTQPIVAPPPSKKNNSDSNKNLFGAADRGTSGKGNGSAAPSAAASFSPAGVLPCASLINPYVQCSSADAMTYSNLSTTLFHLGNAALALRAAHVALQIRCATLRPEQDEFVDVATSLNNLGAILSSPLLRLYPSAFAHVSAAEELLRTRLDPVHPRLALVGANLTKLRTRRQAVPTAPGLLQELRDMASAKEKKEHELREKQNAKAANKKGNKAAAAAPARKPSAGGKKGEEVPKPFHEDPRYFQPPVAGAPPVVPPPPGAAAAAAGGAEADPAAVRPPLPPLGSAAAAITQMPLRQWDVQMGEMQKMLLEFGPAKKKAAVMDAKGKGKKK
jgi:hypothetical protein